MKLYRGTTKDSQGKQTVGDAFFMSPDKAVAQRYAGEGGSISEQSIAFRNLLDASTWVEAKQRLGLKQSDTMETLINKARESGYDGITFKTTNGQEYIHIPASGSSNK